MASLFKKKDQQQQQREGGYLPITRSRSATPPASSSSRREQSSRGRRGSPDAAARRLASRSAQGLPGQVVVSRNREKFVSLPDSSEEPLSPAQYSKQAAVAAAAVPTIFEDLQQDGGTPGGRGRITIYCIAEAFDRKQLEARLRARQSRFLLEQYPDVLYGQYWRPGMAEPGGDCFYFDFGVVAFWGLAEKDEQDVLTSIVGPCQLQPLPAREVEVDEFEFVYSATERPHIQNDTITINYRLSREHLTKMSICFALSQSTKLLVYEERVMEIVRSTRSLPAALASSGKVHVSRKQIAQLIGRVFIQKSAVNLISSVLDTPEFFWSAPDSQQTVYKKVCEYLEYDTRVEVLNNRFHVLQEMLDMLRDHQNAHHAGRLEWIIIYLIVIEVIVGLLEVLGLFGWIGHER